MVGARQGSGGRGMPRIRWQGHAKDQVALDHGKDESPGADISLSMPAACKACRRWGGWGGEMVTMPGIHNSVGIPHLTVLSRAEVPGVTECWVWVGGRRWEKDS